MRKPTPPADLVLLIPAMRERVAVTAGLAAARPELVGDLDDAATDALRQGHAHLSAALLDVRRALLRDDPARAIELMGRATQMAPVDVEEPVPA